MTSQHLFIKDGWVMGIEHCLSYNFNQRPDNTEIDLLVIHNISLPPGEFGGGNVQAFFQNRLDPNAHPYFATIANTQVSSHFFIERSGNIIQFVALHDRAWHAGASSFNGVSNCNDYSIGIELEGTDEIAYTDAQYESLRLLTCELMLRYPKITQQRITGHEHIAPRRKTDPGPSFDWSRYYNSLFDNSLKHE
jgi:N-acetyl-anhydromuramoyl-L-alanine amidase